MRSRRLGYTLPVSKEIGFGHLYHLCDESRSFSADSAASLSMPPVMVARWEARKGLPVLARGVRLTNLSSRRPRLVTSASVFANHTSRRPIMAQSLSPAGTSAQILTHARFDRPPVAQHPRRGRFPKIVTVFWKAASKRRWAEYLVQQNNMKIESIRESINDHEFIAKVKRAELAGFLQGLRVKGAANV